MRSCNRTSALYTTLPKSMNSKFINQIVNCTVTKWSLTIRFGCNTGGTNNHDVLLQLFLACCGATLMKLQLLEAFTIPMFNWLKQLSIMLVGVTYLKVGDCS